MTGNLTAETEPGRATRTEEAHMQNLPRYVLITPARNEEAFIRKTLDSVVQQTFPPIKWVIVNDGSSDNTARIVQEYTARYPWIELVQPAAAQRAAFCSKSACLQRGAGTGEEPRL